MIFERKQLIDEKFYKTLLQIFNEVAYADDFLGAHRLSNELTKYFETDKEFKNEYHELYVKYALVIIKLRWLGLQIVKEERIIDLFQYNFTKIFGIPDFEIWERLKRVLVAIPYLPYRDEVKQKIRTALVKNNEKLTSQKFIINNEIKDATVANWLKDYQLQVGIGVADKLIKSQYLIKGENIKILSIEEKEKVKTLLNIFEKIKLSSMTLEGLEEDVPIDEEYGKGIIVEGVPYLYKKDELENKYSDIAQKIIELRDKKDANEIDRQIPPELDSLKKEAAGYPINSLERKAIEEEIRQMEIKNKK